MEKEEMTNQQPNVKRKYPAILQVILEKNDYNDKYYQFLESIISCLLDEICLETARDIGFAASEAGLAPKDLLSADDWKEAVKKIRGKLPE